MEGYYYANYIFETRRQISYINTSPLQNARGTHVIITLMASVIAAVKLIYGVDDHTRYVEIRALHHVHVLNEIHSDSSCVSQFDTCTTKETWYKQIEKNMARWKSLQDDQDDLKSMIQHLQETSVANKVTAHLRDKHSKFPAVLGQVVKLNNICIRRSFKHSESRTCQSHESSKRIICKA